MQPLCQKPRAASMDRGLPLFWPTKKRCAAARSGPPTRLWNDLRDLDVVRGVGRCVVASPPSVSSEPPRCVLESRDPPDPGGLDPGSAARPAPDSETLRSPARRWVARPGGIERAAQSLDLLAAAQDG